MIIKDITKINFPSNLLKGKTIVISGSGSGIGRQVAKSFSKFGADLILFSKSEEKLESLFDELNKDYSNNVIIQPLDLETAEERDYEKIFRAIRDDYPKIDGLINNAGILGEKKSLEQYSYVSWKNNHELNHALSGKCDLDILIFNTPVCDFNIIANQNGWIEMENPVAKFKSIYHYFKV